jgi:hypothetical protein
MAQDDLSRGQPVPEQRVTPARNASPAPHQGDVAYDLRGSQVQVGGDFIGRDKVVVERQIISLSIEDSRELRDLKTVVDTVLKDWVYRFLTESVHGAAMKELGKQIDPNTLERPWEIHVQGADQEARRILPGEKMFDVFTEMDRNLLILGEPGSGKTTTLVELAYDLCEQAERDLALQRLPQERIPVVLNLASWSRKRLRLEDWLAQELNTQYHISKERSRQWLQKRDLVLLLDGLDEVQFEDRHRCVDEINRFFEIYGRQSVVVCSRKQEYEELQQKLNMHAIVIQKLSDAQVTRYVNAAGRQLTALQQALETDSGLRELAHRPLLLSVMSLAYEGYQVNELTPQGDETAQLSRLFAAYVDRMFVRRENLYPRPQTERYLSWLAKQLLANQQPNYLIEKMQPSWLPSPNQRKLFDLLTALVVLLPISLLSYWFFGNIYAIFMSNTPLTPFFARVVEPLFMLICALTVWLTARRDFRTPALTAVLAGGLGIAAALSIYQVTPDAPWVSVFNGLVIAIGLGIPVELYRRQKLSKAVKNLDPIETVEIKRWIWKRLAIGLLLGLVFGYILYFVFTLTILMSWQAPFRLAIWVIATFAFKDMALFGVSTMLCFMLMAGVIFGLLGGEAEMARVSRPNQGIHRSARNALFVGTLTTLVTGGPYILLIPFYETYRASSLEYALSWGLLIGTAFAMLFGGYTVIQHYTLRLLLWRSRRFPWHIRDFLDFCSGLILLHRAGGGYIFIHRMLMEHFAKMDVDQLIPPSSA